MDGCAYGGHSLWLARGGVWKREGQMLQMTRILNYREKHVCASAMVKAWPDPLTKKMKTKRQVNKTKRGEIWLCRQPQTQGLTSKNSTTMEMFAYISIISDFQLTIITFLLMQNFTF